MASENECTSQIDDTTDSDETTESIDTAESTTLEVKESSALTAELPYTKARLELLPGMTEDDVSTWKSVQQWTRGLVWDLEGQNADPHHPFHAHPYCLQRAVIKHFKKDESMDLQAEVVTKAGKQLFGSVNLAGPDYPTTAVGMMMTVQPFSAPLHDDTTKFLMLTSRPRLSAGRIQFLQLPMGQLGKDGKIHISGGKEITTLLPNRPFRSYNLSRIADDEANGGAEIGEGFKLGIDMTGSLLGQIPNTNTYEHIQIFLQEYRIRDDEFNDMKNKLRDRFKEKERHMAGFQDEKAIVRLIPMTDLPWLVAKDFYFTLAWGLYAPLKACGFLRRMLQEPHRRP